MLSAMLETQQSCQPPPVQAINKAAGGTGAELTPQDIALAASQQGRALPQPPSLQELHALARRVNAQPLVGPSDKQHGIKLPTGACPAACTRPLGWPPYSWPAACQHLAAPVSGHADRHRCSAPAAAAAARPRLTPHSSTACSASVQKVHRLTSLNLPVVECTQCPFLPCAA